MKYSKNKEMMTEIYNNKLRIYIFVLPNLVIDIAKLSCSFNKNNWLIRISENVLWRIVNLRAIEKNEFNSIGLLVTYFIVISIIKYINQGII